MSTSFGDFPISVPNAAIYKTSWNWNSAEAHQNSWFSSYHRSTVSAAFKQCPTHFLLRLCRLYVDCKQYKSMTLLVWHSTSANGECTYCRNVQILWASSSNTGMAHGKMNRQRNKHFKSSSLRSFALFLNRTVIASGECLKTLILEHTDVPSCFIHETRGGDLK